MKTRQAFATSIAAAVATAAIAAVLACANAQAADDAQSQRARIAGERAEANAAYSAREAECRQRFVVTACINEARRQQRDALDGLHREQLLIDEAQRKQRAAQRIDAIRAKVAAEDAGQRKAPVPPAASLRLREQALPPPGPPPAPQHAPEAHAEASVQARQARARAVRGKQAGKSAELQAHRESVAQRNAQRAASGKPPSAPLPVPSLLPQAAWARR